MEVTATSIDVAASQKIVGSGNQTQNVALKQETEVQNSEAQKQDTSSLLRLSNEEIAKMAQQMNQAMQDLSTNIQFKVHEKTKSLMVQVISTQDNKVLKEYPPHEFLDTIAKIREYIGALLDKKA